MALDELGKKSRKEATTVITARLKNSKYNWLKSYCDELGVSINEAINYMVDGEYKIWLKKNTQGNTAENQEKNEDPNQFTIDDIINNDIDDESKVNTKTNNVNTAEMNTKAIQPKNNSAKKAKKNTNGVNWIQFEIDKKVPCPICDKWELKTNISRHARENHETTTKEFYTENIEGIKRMFEEKQKLEKSEVVHE